MNIFYLKTMIKTKTMKSKNEVISQLLDLSGEWFRNIAALRYHRTEEHTHEHRQGLITKRTQEILKTLDADDYDAIMQDGQFSILLGTQGCKDAEAIFGGRSGRSGCSRKARKKGSR